MKSMPPLKALHYFDAAMRHGSFTEAAQELFVTPGAVGQQIRNLEQWLGVALFTRHVRHVQPTAEGIQYWGRIQPALNHIAEASHTLKNNKSHSARISMPPTFAANWFARRIPLFVAAHPAVDLHLSSSTELVDFTTGLVDLAVRYFDGGGSSLDIQLLYRDEARAYCSPAYLRKLDRKDPGSLAGVTLIHTTMHPHWAVWLKRHAGLTPDAIEAIAGMHFDQSLLSIDAAKRHQGVVLTSPLLVQTEVEDGLLVEPFALGLPLDKGFYLVHPRTAQQRPAVQALKQWLIEQAALTGPR